MSRVTGQGITTIKLSTDRSNPSQPRQIAVIRCTTCKAEFNDPIVGKMNPHMVLRRAERNGWQTDPKAFAGCICPKCLRRKAAKKNDPYSEMRRYHAAIDKLIGKPVAMPTERIVLASEIKPDVLAETIQSSRVMPHGGLATAQRVITKDERFKIRSELDKSFDDSAGSYLGDEDDASIAARLDVPKKWVSDMREAAYGPILVDKAALARKREIADARNELDLMTASHAAHIEAQKVANEAFNRRLIAIEQKIAKLEFGK